MDKRAEPVPPIFQPELAAEAIVWASTHRRREVYVGWPSVKAVLANKMVPGVLDRILAKQGYSGQLTEEPKRQDCENLYTACDTNPGSHGRFDRGAKTWSLQWLMTSNPGATFALAAAAVGVLGAFALRARQHRDHQVVLGDEEHLAAARRRGGSEEDVYVSFGAPLRLGTSEHRRHR
jgi:hypothetical protein